jgi:hypothetical protein
VYSWQNSSNRSGDKDDRHIDPIGRDELLQIETIEVRK